MEKLRENPFCGLAFQYKINQLFARNIKFFSWNIKENFAQIAKKF